MTKLFKERHGVLLAGGTGSRLFPITQSVNKHLLPIYNKPMIYYSMSLLMLAKTRTVAIVCNEHDYSAFFNHFGDGRNYGMVITYVFQKTPDGLPSAIALARNEAGDKDITVILGDNVLVGNDLTNILAPPPSDYCKILAINVKDPSPYGVVTFDGDDKVINVIEKPKNLKTGYAVPGVYFFPNSCFEYIKELNISSRGETEISDLLNIFIQTGSLDALKIGRGLAWLDTGTPSGLIDAANLIHTLEIRKNYQIANIHEIAFNNQWITSEELKDQLTDRMNNSYLCEMLD